MESSVARKLIENLIASGTAHKNYKRVNELASDYLAFISNPLLPDGEYALNKKLRQFVRREDADLFEQRKNLTKHYTPSICAQIMKPFNKVIRSNRVYKLIDHDESEVVQDIESSIEKFYGEADNDGVVQFLNTRFKTLTFTDPNAWVLTTFNKFDADKEKPQTFPHEYSSADVIDFSVVNGQTEWVFIKLTYTYLDKNDKSKVSTRYLFFDDYYSYEYKQVPKDIKTPFEYDNEWIESTKTRDKYAIYQYEHRSKKVPLMRVGYVPDIETDDLTFVNPFHYEAMPLLEQFVKISSELQLSITLHTFPKQVSYVQVCEAKGCNEGMLADGISACQVCEGSGKKVHTTSADVIELPMPKRIDKESMIDVGNISKYVEFPGHVMEFLDNYAEKIEKKIMRMVFNSESLVQTQFKTATESNIDMDSIYDTLFPFGEKYSEMWMFIVKLTVLYRGHDNVLVWHKFPSDLKLKSMKQLLDELKTANDSNAPSYIRESINNDIMDIIYSDDQTELSKLKIKNKHFPFPGKSDFEIQNIILNNITTKTKQILYANFDNIFDEVEAKHSGFYEMTYAKQKLLINDEVNIIIEDISPNVGNVLNLN